MCVFIFLVKFGYLCGRLIGKIAAHLAYDMFSSYKYLGFWSGNFFDSAIS